MVMDASIRLNQLRAEIEQYNHQYYVLGFSPISDADYDKLYFDLVQLEVEHPHLVDACSPTQRVGAVSETSGFKKVKHSDQRMLSLDNMKTAADVIHYLGQTEVVMEPKIDGASLKLIYQQGRLVQAITRGDGTMGDDVTANARAIKTIPLRLEDAIDITVVGEVYMTYTVFNELNSQLAGQDVEIMANPRNAAAGSLKLKNPAEVAARKLSYVPYGTTTEFPNLTQDQLTEYFGLLGFKNISLLPVVQSCQTVSDCFLIENEAMLARRIAEADACRRFLDLPTDGLVFKLNDIAKQRELGEGTKYPKYACAYKFPPERKATTLLSISIQIGRTGKVTPVAELQPVLLGGTTVRRASLCNQNEINRLNVDIGDTVLVEKSAEIIPKIMGVAEKVTGKVYQLPLVCPGCAHPLTQPAGFVDYYCSNDTCPDRVFALLHHACGKTALDIDGCGETLVRELIAHGVKRLSDVFRIDPFFMKAAARKRFNTGRVECRAQPLWRKLHALGIEGFGQTLCQAVGERWQNLDAAFADEDGQTLCKLVGAVVYNNLVDYCLKQVAELDALDSLIGLTGSERYVGPLAGKSFCITGDLLSGGRNAVSRRIEHAGGVVKSSVSRHLSYLVQGTETGKTKRAAAEKYGIPVITEQTLFELMEQDMPVPKAVEDREY